MKLNALDISEIVFYPTKCNFTNKNIDIKYDDFKKAYPDFPFITKSTNEKVNWLKNAIKVYGDKIIEKREELKAFRIKMEPSLRK